MNQYNFKTFLGYATVVSAIGLAGILAAVVYTSESLHAQQSANNVARASAAFVPQMNIDPADITADASYVYDIVRDQTLFVKNAEAQLPLASLAKMPLALLARAHLEPNTRIIISQSSLAPEGDSGFVAGESWLAQDLIDFTLMTSSNDGAAALAETIEAKTGTAITTLLNEFASANTLTQTYFLNETGLDYASMSLSGSYGSARDVAKLFAHSYNTDPNIFAATAISEHTFANENGKTYESINTNQSIHALPGLVFGKTGFTDLAGGNLAVVVETEPGHPYVIVVLGSTQSDRFEDVITIYDAILRSQHK